MQVEDGLCALDPRVCLQVVSPALHRCLKPCAVPLLYFRRLALRQVYCSELAFMLASIFMLIFWETRRKDFPVMMTHHVATISLIAISYYLK